MRNGRRILALAALMLLGGCSVAGPILDTQMDDAPFQACAQLAAEPGTPQCLSLFRRGPSGEVLPAGSGHMRAGETLYASRAGGESCAGDFTHAVAAGDTTGPGKLRLAVADAVGRGDVGRTFSWDEAHINRRWSVGRIDTPVHIPATVRVHVEEGEVRLTSLCLKSYRRHYRRLT